MTHSKPNVKRAYFNLIEIALALGVLSIGLMGTLGLFSVGLNSNRDAIGRNYSADAADELLHQLAASIKEDWGQVDNFEPSPVDVSTEEAGPYDDASWTNISESAGNLYYRDYSGGRVYRVVQDRPTAADPTIKIVDFDAMVRIWKTPSRAWEYDPDAGSWSEVEDVDYDHRVIMNVEMSWPATLPFHARQKAYFTMEVAKNND